jgi:hypothetical protein
MNNDFMAIAAWELEESVRVSAWEFVGMVRKSKKVTHACGAVATLIPGSGNGREWYRCPSCRVEFHVSSIREERV